MTHSVMTPGTSFLKKAADIFRDNFRNDDMIARIGGDEFCMILPGTSKREALTIIQRIKMKCIFESSEKLPISISFGIAEKNSKANIKNALKGAEKVMYHDKRRTRIQKGSS